MKFYWIKTYSILKKIFPYYFWDIPNNENKVFLTFDDGPTPEISNWVLSELRKHQAKATFFCIGNNIEKFPEIYQNILNENHAVANHTFNHVNGWKTSDKEYIENILKCDNLQTKIRKLKFKIFRPPYGKIKPSQSRKLRKLGYKIIMWDILSADFDVTITPEKCLDNVLKNIQSGSIIVFHDSEKAFKNLKYVLPRTLEFLKVHNYICEAII